MGPLWWELNVSATNGRRESPNGKAGWIPFFRKIPEKWDLVKLGGSTQWLEINHKPPQFFVSGWWIK